MTYWKNKYAIKIYQTANYNQLHHIATLLLPIKFLNHVMNGSLFAFAMLQQLFHSLELFGRQILLLGKKHYIPNDIGVLIGMIMVNLIPLSGYFWIKLYFEHIPYQKIAICYAIHLESSLF